MNNEALQQIDGEGASLKDALKNLREETAAKQKMLLQAERNIRVAEKQIVHQINEQKEMESQYATHATKLEKEKDEVLRAARTDQNYLKE